MLDATNLDYRVANCGSDILHIVRVLFTLYLGINFELFGSGYCLWIVRVKVIGKTRGLGPIPKFNGEIF